MPLPVEYRLPGPVTDYEAFYTLGPMNNAPRPDGKPRRSREFVMEQVRVPAAGLVIEGTAGRCGASYKPWILLRHRKTQRGLGLELAYPGNWRRANRHR